MAFSCRPSRISLISAQAHCVLIESIEEDRRDTLLVYEAHITFMPHAFDVKAVFFNEQTICFRSQANA